MAVIVRSTSASLAVLRRALITAGVPVTVRGEDLPLAEQTAVSQLLTALGAACAGPAHRRRRGRTAARRHRRRRCDVAAPAAARAAAAGARRG